MKDTRNKIINTAIELFKENGYENTTINLICENCNITKGTFYYHFANKDEITFAYYEQLYENFTDVIPDILIESDTKEQLWKLIEYSIDNTISLTPKVLKAFILSDMQRGLEFFSFKKVRISSKQRLKQYNLQLQLIKKGQNLGEIKNGNPEMMLDTFIAALIGIACDWASNDGYYDEKEELRKAFDIIF